MSYQLLFNNRQQEELLHRANINYSNYVHEFDPVQYLQKYDDLMNAFGNDVVKATQHFVEHGAFEGRTCF